LNIIIIWIHHVLVHVVFVRIIVHIIHDDSSCFFSIERKQLKIFFLSTSCHIQESPVYKWRNKETKNNIILYFNNFDWLVFNVNLSSISAIAWCYFNCCNLWKCVVSI
jgi:hypothetical protein